MKIFLNTCIVAMISAGIYGTIDVAKDISNDAYIQYETDENNVASNAVQQKGLSNVIRTARREVTASSEKKKIVREPELNMEYFSRSGPVYADQRLFELTAATDSVKSDSAKIRGTQIVSAVNDPPPLPDTVLVEKRKFDISLYSRGRPRKIIRPETVVDQNDSLKK